MPGPKLGLFSTVTAASLPHPRPLSPAQTAAPKTSVKTPLGSSSKGSWRKALPWFQVVHSPLSTKTLHWSLAQTLPQSRPPASSGSLQPQQGAPHSILPPKSDPAVAIHTCHHSCHKRDFESCCAQKDNANTMLTLEMSDSVWSLTPSLITT